MWSIFPCAFIFVHLVSRIYLLKLDSWKLTFLLNSFSMICCYLLFSRKVVSDSVTPWTAARQASLSFTVSWSLVRLMSLESVMPSNHLVFCRPLSFCPQSFPASGSFPVSQFFASGNYSIGTSASAPVLPMNIQGWFPLGLTGLISLLSSGLSTVFFSTTVQKHHFFGAQLSLWSNSHIHTWLLEKP